MKSTVVQLWLDRAQAYLKRCGVPEAAANAEFLMVEALKTSSGGPVSRGNLWLRRREVLPKRPRDLFWRRVRARGRRMPLAYVLGTQPFMGLDLHVNSAVLIPRPETESVVETALELVGRPTPARRLQVLDLGSGSGCIALALASALPECRVLGVDLSRRALAVAARNAERCGLSHRVRFIRGDFSAPSREIDGFRANLVVSNPPYVPSARIARLEPEVRREPRAALDGGADGLSAIRVLLARVHRRLAPGGWLVLEIDHGQGRAVRRLLKQYRFSGIGLRQDASGLERVAFGRRAVK